MRSSSDTNTINPSITGAATVVHQPLAVFFQKFIIDANSGRKLTLLGPKMFVLSSLTRSAHRGSRNTLVSYLLARQMQNKSVENKKAKTSHATTRLLLSVYHAGPAAAIGVTATHYLELLQFRFAKEDVKNTSLNKLLIIDPMTLLKTWRASIVPSTIRTAGLMGLGNELDKLYDERLSLSGKEKSQTRQVVEKSLWQGAGMSGLEAPFLIWSMYGITQNLNGKRVHPSAKHFIRVGAITIPCAFAINGSFFGILNTATVFAKPHKQAASPLSKKIFLFTEQNIEANSEKPSAPRCD